MCRGMAAISEPSLDVESAEVSNDLTEFLLLCLAEIEMIDDRSEGVDNDEVEVEDAVVEVVVDDDDVAKDMSEAEF